MSTIQEARTTADLAALGLDPGERRFAQMRALGTDPKRCYYAVFPASQALDETDVVLAAQKMERRTWRYTEALMQESQRTVTASLTLVSQWIEEAAGMARDAKDSKALLQAAKLAAEVNQLTGANSKGTRSEDLIAMLEAVDEVARRRENARPTVTVAPAGHH